MDNNNDDHRQCMTLVLNSVRLYNICIEPLFYSQNKTLILLPVRMKITIIVVAVGSMYARSEKEDKVLSL